MAALARGLGAACRTSVARLRPAESDVRSMPSTRSKTVGAVRQVRGGAEAGFLSWCAGWASESSYLKIWPNFEVAKNAENVEFGDDDAVTRPSINDNNDGNGLGDTDVSGDDLGPLHKDRLAQEHTSGS